MVCSFPELQSAVIASSITNQPLLYCDSYAVKALFFSKPDFCQFILNLSRISLYPGYFIPKSHSSDVKKCSAWKLRLLTPYSGCKGIKKTLSFPAPLSPNLRCINLAMSCVSLFIVVYHCCPLHTHSNIVATRPAPKWIQLLQIWNLTVKETLFSFWNHVFMKN